MDKKTITQIATAALITTAGISVTNNLKPLNITGSGNEVKAATTQSAQQFIDKAAPAAVNASSKYGTYTSVMMAQAAVESGWGNSTLSQEPNNNLFGIKGSYNGQSVTMKTGEYGSNGYYTTNANFRKYPSYEESFNDNGSLLRSQMGSYYSGTWVENASSGKEATKNGLQGKYATAPNYASTLNNVIDTYNLKQYDPVTTDVNETKTVTNTTPIVDAPVDSDVGTQVGTAREGQQLNVTKYITYQNGVKHAYVGSGWVNNSAFATTQPTTTDTSASQTTQPTQTTQATQPSTSQTATVKQPAAQPAKPATTQVQATKAVQTNAVKTPQAVKKTTVSQVTSAAKTVEAVVKTSTSKTTATAIKSVATVAKATPKATTTKSVQKVAKTTATTTPVASQQTKKTEATASVATTKPVATTQTKAAVKTTSSSKKATVEKTDTVKAVVKEAGVTTPVVDDTKKNDTKKATVVTTTTKAVKAKAAKPAPVEAKTSTKSEAKTTTVAVAPKAAVAAVVKTTEKATTPAKTVKSTKTVSKSTTTSNATQKVATKTVKSAKVVTTDAVQPVATKKTTAKAKSAVVVTSKTNSKVEKLATKPIVETTTTKKVSAEASQIGNNDYVIKAKGVLTINARPDYGVAIWTVPGKKRTSRYLKNGTSWKFFKIAMINGEKWYNLGGNQWVPAKAVMVR